MSQTLTCPKCQSEMRSYERNRVLVDQCNGCGGIFLDKGELEALAAAENAWHDQQQTPAQPVAQQQAPQPPPQQYQQPQQYAQPQQGGYAQGYPPAQRHSSSKVKYGYGHQGGYRKKKSFLDDLFG